MPYLVIFSIFEAEARPLKILESRRKKVVSNNDTKNAPAEYKQSTQKTNHKNYDYPKSPE
jgi:hypothetical protein